ncbi:hypothetical protein BH23GEM9_BH23GEM9_06820 [soil metagenome]
MRTWREAVMVIGALAVAAACGERETDLNRVSRTYASSLGVDLAQMQRMESGLYIRDIRVGEGAIVEPGNAVLVHYTGWLADGTQFATSHDRGTPLDVVIGRGDMIRGWDEGVPGMREGGQRRLVIPPALGYGIGGAGGVIPGGATLVFDVEVVEVLDPVAPGGG